MGGTSKELNYKEMRKIALMAIGGAEDAVKRPVNKPEQRSIARRVVSKGPVVPKPSPVKKMIKEKLPPPKKEVKIKQVKKTGTVDKKFRTRAVKKAKRKVYKQTDRKPKKSRNAGFVFMIFVVLTLELIWFGFIIYNYFYYN